MRAHRLEWSLRGVGQCLAVAPWLALLAVTLAGFAAIVVCWSVLDQMREALGRGRAAVEWRLFVRRRVRAEIAQSAITTGHYAKRRSTKP